MKQALAVFGGLFGLALLLAAIFKPTLLPGQTPYVRLSAAIIGILFIVLAILTLSGTVFT